MAPRSRRSRVAAAIVASAAIAMTHRAASQRHSCQGRVCWPEGARPAWLDAAYAGFDGMEYPQIGAGQLHARATLFAPTGLDANRCVLSETWRGTRSGPRGTRESLHGEAHSGPPIRVVPAANGGVSATFEVSAPMPGTQIALESFAFVECGDVTFSLSSIDNITTTTDVLPLVCALRPPAGTPRDVHVRLPARVLHVRVGARFGVALRSRGLALVDECTGRVVLDLTTLGVPVSGVNAPASGTLSARDRALALWGPQYSQGSSSNVVRSFHGFNGDWFGFTLARPLTRAELVHLRDALARVEAFAWVDTMDDVPQPGDPPSRPGE